MVVAADVGWTLCGYGTMYQPAAAAAAAAAAAVKGDGEGGDGEFNPDYSSDPLDWSLKHSACAVDVCPEGAGKNLHQHFISPSESRDFTKPSSSVF